MDFPQPDQQDVIISIANLILGLFLGRKTRKK